MSTGNRQACTAGGPPLLALWLTGIAVLLSFPVRSQILLESDRAQLTVEGFANITAASVDASRDLRDHDDIRSDGGLRVLGRSSLTEGLTLGVRLAIEGRDDDARLTEASVLLFDKRGRLEIGERMGLPDVLTGYAPNNFQFTSAEFGPASGPSLDPGGGLQTAFLRGPLAERIRPLSALGATAAMFDDRSAKLLYVSPKMHGWLAGASYARDADDDAFGQLFQAGITHESYWHQSIVRWGATFARAQGAPAPVSRRDLQSVGIGASLTLNEAWTVGLAASHDGRSRLPQIAAGSFASPAWGATVSVNYNAGPWTVGGYGQYATGEGSTIVAGNDRFVATEVGASYRFTTKLRLYGAWYRFDLVEDGRGATTIGNMFLLGIRATL
jgi:hypothetical protein